MSDFDPIQMLLQVTVMIIPAILAITVHEASHAYAARYFGDDTAERMGRTSLNPLVHIDPFGTVILPILTVLFGGGFFGWAKPVPVLASRLRNPAKDMPMVALAGPVSNLLMALIWMVLLIVLGSLMARDTSGFFYQVAQMGVRFNLVLFAFNMLPILPLDGGRVLMGLLPADIARHFVPMERYGMMIVIFLAFAMGGLLWNVWVNPIVNAASQLLHIITAPLQMLF